MHTYGRRLCIFSLSVKRTGPMCFHHCNISLRNRRWNHFPFHLTLSSGAPWKLINAGFRNVCSHSSISSWLYSCWNRHHAVLWLYCLTCSSVREIGKLVGRELSPALLTHSRSLIVGGKVPLLVVHRTILNTRLYQKLLRLKSGIPTWCLDWIYRNESQMLLLSPCKPYA
jgi:hypothetical protein